MGGRFGSEWVAAFDWNGWPGWLGISTLTDAAAGEMGDAAVAMINGGIVCFPPEGGVNAPAHGGTIDAPGIF